MERNPLNDLGFLADAKHVSFHSKDPSTKVGCVIIRPDRTQASAGFNGFPRGVNDTEIRLNDRKSRLAFTVHAEVNAIITAREPLHGYTLYCTHSPCAECAKFIVQAGIKRVVSHVPPEEFRARWHESFEFASLIFEEGGVNLTWY